MPSDQHHTRASTNPANTLDVQLADFVRASSPSPFFLEKLQDIRLGDAVSGGVWQQAPHLTTRQAMAMAHIDRATEGLDTVLSLLQASETCRRRRPEDFGIGEDRHEGLVFAARELVHGIRERLDTLEARRLRER